MLTTLEYRLYHHLLDICKEGGKTKFLESEKFKVFRTVARKLYKQFMQYNHSYVSTNLPTHITSASIIIDSHSMSLSGDYTSFKFYGSLYRATKKFKDNLT